MSDGQLGIHWTLVGEEEAGEKPGTSRFFTSGNSRKKHPRWRLLRRFLSIVIIIALGRKAFWTPHNQRWLQWSDFLDQYRSNYLGNCATSSKSGVTFFLRSWFVASGWRLLGALFTMWWMLRVCLLPGVSKSPSRQSSSFNFDRETLITNYNIDFA